MRLLSVGVLGPLARLVVGQVTDEISDFDGDIDDDRLLPTGNDDEYYYYSPPEFAETYVDQDDEPIELKNTSLTNDAIIQEIAQYQVKHNISDKVDILEGFKARSGSLRLTGSSGLINHEEQNKGDRKRNAQNSGLLNRDREEYGDAIRNDFSSFSGCPDLFEDFTEHNEFYNQVPIYGVGMRKFTPLVLDVASGMAYSEETKKACSGKNAKHGDLCALTCPNNKDSEMKPMTKNRRLKWSFKPPRHEQFRCVCSRDEKNDEVCFWSPEEKLWQNPRTCDMSAPFQRLHFRMGIVTNSWKRILYKRRRRQKPEKIGETDWPINDQAWAKAVDYRKNMESKKTNYDQLVLDEGEKFKKPYENLKEIEYLLIDDEIYQNTLDDLSIYGAADDGFLIEEDNWTSWQRARAQKTEHLLHLIGYFLLARDSGRNFKPSNFLQYGCYCNEHTPKGQNQGKGVAKDPIDQICHGMAMCRQCANIEVGEKCHSLRPYNFKVSYNQDTGSASMTCLDKAGNSEVSNCRANLCQCDKALVEGITTFSHQAAYNVELSATWGQFYKETECRNGGKGGNNKKNNKKATSDRAEFIEEPEEEQRPCHFTENGCRAPDECCGEEYPYKKPFWSDDGQRKCCGSQVFNSYTHQCCFDKSVNKGSDVC
jgi:hypothetical protein